MINYSLADYENGFGTPDIDYFFVGLKNLYSLLVTPQVVTVVTWLPTNSYERMHFSNFRMLNNETGSFKYTYNSSKRGMKY